MDNIQIILLFSIMLASFCNRSGVCYQWFPCTDPFGVIYIITSLAKKKKNNIYGTHVLLEACKVTKSL